MKTINADAFRNTLSDDRRVTLYDGAVLGADGVLVKLSTVYGLLNEAPAVDAVPVVHGQWLTSSNIPDMLICSVCGKKFDMYHYDQKNMPFCLCGAKMDGGTNNG